VNKATAVFRHVALAIGLAAGLAATMGYGAEAPALPAGFVRLRAVDASIVQDIRYATAHNFTQAPVPGYLAGECVVLREVANALKLVQVDLRVQGLSLKLYDCYRPFRAVKAFMSWVQNPASPGDARYWPRTQRDDLIKDGYIAANSVHSRGAAVDLTLIALPPAPKQPVNSKSVIGPCNSKTREPDNSIDMGTTFDCFDPMSNTANEEITPEQYQNREMLSAAMAQQGFKNYAREWWHFTFIELPGLPKALDFAITK
jgi:D-alanyl-D-alanine dipeptidase